MKPEFEDANGCGVSTPSGSLSGGRLALAKSRWWYSVNPCLQAAHAL